MATIKSYTDIEQSQKLAEILPLESADMHYSKDFDGSWFVDLAGYTSVKIPKYVGNIEEHLLPCWSLAALLEQLKSEIILENKQILFLHLNKYDDNSYEIRYTNSRTGEILIAKADNPVNACVEMIIKLHEQNLL